MKQYKLTVIVPTRERLQTLKWTLKTLSEQSYNNLEIIVSDNFSQDGTGEYVKSLTDPRIKYINTGKRLGMSGNYEFALSFATGDFVTYVGDDDGFVFGALEECNRLLNEHHARALVWTKANYIWNGFHIPYLTNTLDIPGNTSVYVADTKEEMEGVIRFQRYNDYQIPCYFLPCVYNSFIDRHVLNEAKEKQGGKFFHSRYPDIYSSMLLPYFLEKYIYSHIPFTVNGVSSSSNGTGSILITTKKESYKESEKFESESTINIHRNIRFTDFASIPFITMESYLQVCDSLKIEPIHFNIDNLAKEAIAYAKRFTPETLPWTIESIKETCRINNHPFTYESEITHKPGLLSWVKKFLLSLLRLNKSLYVFYLRKYRGKDIDILKEPYENNILGACRLAGKKLGFIK